MKVTITPDATFPEILFLFELPDSDSWEYCHLEDLITLRDQLNEIIGDVR